MLTLAWPWLLALLPLPILVRLFLPASKKDVAPLKVPFFSSIGTLASGGDQPTSRFAMLIAGLVWCSVVIAAARPQWVGEPVSLPLQARDMMLAVDISGSMKRKDLSLDGEAVTRLDVVKSVLADFVDRRKGDRLGLILFGTQAYLQAPLTLDRETLSHLLNEAQIGFAGEKTAIGDAIGLAIKRLQNQPATQRTLILLTDGANTAGQVTPEQATELAQQVGVRIHTIGVGADEMMTEGFFGFGKRKINPSADLDEALLNSIAEQTGGNYFRARDTEELNSIYQTLDAIEPTEQDPQEVLPTQALFYWPLGFALLLAFASWIVSRRPWQVFTTSTEPQAKEGTL